MGCFGRYILNAAAIAASVGLGASAQAATISIGNGATPAGGYLGLSVFGIAPQSGAAGNGFLNVNIAPVTFAGQNWTRVAMGEDGLLVFGDTSAIGSSAINQSLPGGGAAAILAPFWTDLDLTTSGEMRIGALTDGRNDWVVFDWSNMALAGGGTATFQVWMRVGADDVTFAYGNVSAPALLTVGAQDATGTVGVNHAFNGTGFYPVNGTQLAVRSSGLPLAAVPEPASWALLILGFGLAGAGARRQRRVRLHYA